MILCMLTTVFEYVPAQEITVTLQLDPLWMFFSSALWRRFVSLLPTFISLLVRQARNYHCAKEM